MLPKSNSYIQGIYREWSSVAIDDEEDAEEDEAVEIEDDSAEIRPNRCLDIHRTKVVVDGQSLVASLDAMSISPVRLL
jgi:RNA polymerase I-specific transcription initiation factor RRN3